jgi:hypothetical protein
MRASARFRLVFDTPSRDLEFEFGLHWREQPREP